MSEVQKIPGLTIDGGTLAGVFECRREVVKTINVSDLETLVADCKYVVARGDGKELLLTPALNTIEPLLPEGFVRVSRGVIVALGKIGSVVEHQNEAGGPRTTVFMVGGGDYDVSRRNRKNFRSAVKARSGGAE